MGTNEKDLSHSNEKSLNRSSSTIPWKEMFETAASSPLSHITPTRYLHSRSSPALGSVANSHEAESAQKPPLPRKKESKHALSATKASYDHNATEISENAHYGTHQILNNCQNSGLSVSDENSKEVTVLNQQYHQLAMYIAMAHGVLIFLVIVMYGIWKLLGCYQKPIQWAVLCSMPLRAIHEAIRSFWETSLKQGLFGTLLAIPLAICKAIIVSTLDARLALLHLIGKRRSQQGRKVKFTTLTEWLVSFTVLTLAYEYMGSISFAIIPFVVISFYSFGVLLGLVPEIEELEMEAKRSLLVEPSRRWKHARTWFEWALLPLTKVYKLFEAWIIGALLNNLRHLVAIFLIVLMIFGSLSGLVLFSYKIGLEGKDVVVALKSHVERSNYVEKVGLKQWMEENNIPELIDSYSGKAYDVVSSQIDVFAEKYQMTELADVGKQYFIQLARGQWRRNLADNSNTTELVQSHPILVKTQALVQKCREYDLKGAYLELQQGGHFILEHLNIPREELLDKAKKIGERWLGVGKHVFANSSILVFAIARLIVSSASTILSGAPELLSFCADSFIFFSVLHYLIISKSGGVMEQVLGMLPLSKSTRTRCAEVLDDAVSSVLLATVKAAFFQAAFTWLLFRLLNIHFLYMSTLLAFFSAIVPLIPTWWSSIPAVAQLAMEGRYIQAGLLMAAHIGVMDYGVGAIQSGIPGNNAYLTGLSIAGGIALFSSTLEGAIMGPLLMTVAISLKNLYTEFVLTTPKQP